MYRQINSAYSTTVYVTVQPFSGYHSLLRYGKSIGLEGLQNIDSA